jgi:hypothetical protein
MELSIDRTQALLNFVNSMPKRVAKEADVISRAVSCEEQKDDPESKRVHLS